MNIKDRLKRKFNMLNDYANQIKGDALRAIDIQFFKATGRALPIQWRYPAQEFEKQLNIKNISRIYIMPDNKTMLRIAKETKFKEQNLEERNHTLSAIIKLNPELKKINYDKTEELDVEDFLFGVTSGFNPDDINYYIQTNSKKPGTLLNKGQTEKLAMHYFAQEQMNIRHIWHASRPTLQSIAKQTGHGEFNPSPEELYKKALELEEKLKPIFNPELINPHNDLA